MNLPTPYQGNEKYIFISYSHKDASKVDEIIRKLSEDGCNVWFNSGIEQIDNIVKYIENCECFIAFFSKNYLDSIHCNQEFHSAVAGSKQMLIVYLEEIALPYGVSMRMMRSHRSLFKYKYDSDEEFYEMLFSDDCLEQCKNTEEPLLYPVYPMVDVSCSFGMGKSSVLKSMLSQERFKKRTKLKPEPTTVDSVQFSAVFQEKAEKGRYLPVNIIMYEDAYRSVVDFAKESIKLGSKEVHGGYHDIERNSSIKVVLSSPDVSIGEQAEERVWNGKYLNFEFAVMFPDDYNKKQALLKAAVYVNGVILTRLNLIVDYEEGCKPDVSITRSDVKSVFVSYASQDRDRVAARIQGMKKVREDLDIFFDIENLKSGQIWEEKLKSEIENRDMLYLCWSKHARESEWVDKEWRYALEKKGEDCIDPIPIDAPEECPPPAELNKKHFNDKMLYIIKAIEKMNLPE